MKDYELTVVFHPDLEMNIDPALDKVKSLIKGSKGEIKKEEVDGKKRLAYSIKKQDFGIYYYFVVALPSEAPQKISNTLNITDEVLRYLLVRADERRAKLAASTAKAETKAKAEDAKDQSTEEKGE